MNADEFLTALTARVNTQEQGVVGLAWPAPSGNGWARERWVVGRAPGSPSAYYCPCTLTPVSPRARRLRATAADFNTCFVIVLDDIGSKIPPERITLEPTYVLESSPGNFQYGYQLRQPVSAARANALVRALMEAGLTDGGRPNYAGQVMRLPGSLNTKRDPHFVASLVSFDPDLLWSFEELEEGFNVVISDNIDVVNTALPPPLADGEVDPVYDWLAGHGMVTGGADGRGWVPIACPWAEGHSTEGGTDYFPGAPGAFKCLHEHCAGRTTGDLKDWIRGQDPAFDDVPGMDARVAALGAVLQGLAVGGGRFLGGQTPDVAAAVLADVIHVASEDCFYSRETGCLVKKDTVNMRWYVRMTQAGLLTVANAAGRVSTIEPVVWLKRCPQTAFARGITHRLGEALMTPDGYLNIAPPWPEAPVAPGAGAADLVRLWRDLLIFVCSGNIDHADLVMDWCALVVGSREKPGWHLIFKSVMHGVGKNMIFRPLLDHFGDKLCFGVSSEVVGGNFTEFLQARFITMDESKQTSRGGVSKHDVYSHLKIYTTQGEKTITVNAKNKRPYSCHNLSAWVITSNEDQPLALEDGDRRFMVIEGPMERKPSDYYAEIVDWYENRGGYAAVISHLAWRWATMSDERRAVLRGPAPGTLAKAELVGAVEEGTVLGAIRTAIAGAGDVVWPDLMTISDMMLSLKSDPAEQSGMILRYVAQSLTPGRIARALKAVGAVQLNEGQPVNGDGANRGVRPRLWLLRPQKQTLYAEFGCGAKLWHEWQRQRGLQHALNLGYPAGDLDPKN